MNNLFLKTFALLLIPVSMSAAPKRNAVQPPVSNDETILHVWSWNFPTIAKNMKSIADAGFTMIQTSPVQHCYAPEGSCELIFDPDVKRGNWYFYYQPTDWKIGNPIVGTRQQMSVMLDSARKHNIRVLVDVLPNHTAVDVDAVEPDFYRAVGGRNKMFHSNGLKLINDYSDREQCTLWAMGALPDVNTENPDFQKYYLDFVNDLLSLGVRGFRYDTAKHIGVHSDPVDTASGVKENDFWDVVTGRKSVKGTRLALPADSLFIYGEVLQDRGVPELEYADYMGLTASSYGHVLRDVLKKRSAKGIDLYDWHHSAPATGLTTWVESHDTYCNEHESAGLSDEQIRIGWVFLTARQNGTPLFFSRPGGSTRKNYWGDNVLGARGNDEYMHPEVVAVNNFRKAMSGEKEDIQVSESGSVLLVNRGKRGAALVNVESMSQSVDLPTGLKDGVYHDVVYGREFIVRKGRLQGALGPRKSYILMK